MKKAKAELLKKIHGGQVCQIVAATARLGLADCLKDESKTLETLAGELNVDSAILSRLIAALVALHLLEENQALYSLTEEGRYLISDAEDSLQPIAVYKGSPFLWNAHGKLYEGIKSGASPFHLAFGEELFSYLEKHPEHTIVFQKAMECYEKQSSKKILDLYPFQNLDSFLDIGGGLGSFALTIIKKYPHMSGTIFDFPSVIEQIDSPLLSKMGGDFFHEIPNGFSAYILRNILHDWSDERCLKILKNLQKACSYDSRLLIFETLVQKSHDSRLGKFADLTMFTLTPGGQERTEEEIVSLLKQSGFKAIRTYRTTSSKSLIEATIRV